jgi:hypothetical protein
LAMALTKSFSSSGSLGLGGVLGLSVMGRGSSQFSFDGSRDDPPGQIQSG